MPLGNFVMAGGTPSILQVHHIDVTLVLGDREIKAVRADGDGKAKNAKRWIVEGDQLRCFPSRNGKRPYARRRSGSDKVVNLLAVSRKMWARRTHLWVESSYHLTGLRYNHQL